MRTVLGLLLIFPVVATQGCSDPQCGSDEYKVADLCYKKRGSTGATDSSTSPAQAFATLDSSSPTPSDAAVGANLVLDALAPSVNVSAEKQDSAERDSSVPGSSPVDAMPTCNPTLEVCDAVDNDCDQQIDEGVKTRCWPDSDNDGFAAHGATPVELCGECGASRTKLEPSSGSTADCADDDAKRSPSVTDICGDMIDNDCDGSIDDDSNNACGGPCTTQLAGRPGQACSNGLVGACARSGTYRCLADKTLTCSAEMAVASSETCNAIDDDCDGATDEGVKNECGGCTALSAAVNAPCSTALGECQATGSYQCKSTEAVSCDAQARAASAETCDGKDNDCDGQIDDGVKNACGGCEPLAHSPGTPCSAGVGACAGIGTFQCQGADTVSCSAAALDAPIWYNDCDGDGFAVLEGSIKSCEKPAPTSSCMASIGTKPVAGSTLDCNDSSAAHFPGQQEYVTAAFGNANLDSDCNGQFEVSTQKVTIDEGGSKLVTPLCSVSPTCVPPCPEGQSYLPCDAAKCARIITQTSDAPVVCGEVKVRLFMRTASGFCASVDPARSWSYCR